MSGPNGDTTRPSGSALTKITQEELDTALANHATWYYSDGKAGKQADLRRTDLTNLKFGTKELAKALLSGSNLRGIDLKNANLQEADMRAVNLEAADLRLSNLQNADLREANLRSATLQGSNLLGAKLDSADLQDACLTDDGKSGNVLGLSATQFSGTDLSGAKLGTSLVIVQVI